MPLIGSNPILASTCFPPSWESGQSAGLSRRRSRVRTSLGAPSVHVRAWLSGRAPRCHRGSGEFDSRSPPQVVEPLVAKSVDAPDSGSGAFGCAGSRPAEGTSNRRDDPKGVDVAQLAELRVVGPMVVGSSPTVHPLGVAPNGRFRVGISQADGWPGRRRRSHGVRVAFRLFAPVAQWTERRHPRSRVRGSTPLGRARTFNLELAAFRFRLLRPMPLAGLLAGPTFVARSR